MTHDDRGRLVLALFERYYDRVYRFARRSADAVTAEDVAQEVFSRLLDLKDLERKHIGSSYLIKVADNVLKRRYHAERRHRAVREERAAHTGQHIEPERSAERLERAEVFRKCVHDLRVLSDDEQAALGLVVCRGLSYREAATALGVETSAINNWRARGLQRLRSGSSHATGPSERVIEHTPRRARGRDQGGQGPGQGPSAASHRSREAG